MPRKLISFVLLSFLVSCSDDEDLVSSRGGEDSSLEVAPEVDPVDSATEETVDEGIDAEVDSTVVMVDSASDASADTTLDAPVDAVFDTAPEVVFDTAPEVVIDTAPEVAIDTSPPDTAECATAGDCAGADTTCAKRTCVAGKCGVMFTPAGTATATQTARDCKRNECDGAGNIVSVADATDSPDDGNECTTDVCSGPTPVFSPRAVGTPCATGYCSAAAACVQCITAATCPGADTECRARSCAGNVCGFANTPAGTATAAQVAGDCKKVECDGMGATRTVANATDTKDDGNECTVDSCSGTMTPVHTFAGGSVRCGPIKDGYCEQDSVGIYCFNATYP